MGWIIDGTNNGFPYPEDCASMPSKPMVKPYPLMLWRIESGENDGFPFFLLQPEPAPPIVPPKPQHKYICVYEKNSEKLAFDTNGLAILTPTKCEVHTTINGMRSVQMTHPMDAEGRYKLLVVPSIIKVNDQLYTIKTVDDGYHSASGDVVVYAEDIWYQQMDGWLFPDDHAYNATSGKAALDIIEARTDYQYREGAFIYAFQWASDITGVNFCLENTQGQTPIDAILGSGGLIDQIGGELYRDRFYFSVNERMENARDYAFDIRIGKNLTGIRRTVDTSTMCTYFRAYDAWGGWVAFAWDFEAWFGDVFPHYVVRSQNFGKPDNADDEDFDYSYYFENIFIPQAEAFFKRNCKPIIGFRIELEDVRSNPDFEIIADETLNVGDRGTLFDSRLGFALEVEITETVYDAVHDKVTSILVGDKQSFVQTAMPPLVIGINPTPISCLSPILDADGNLILDADGKLIVQEGGV